MSEAQLAAAASSFEDIQALNAQEMRMIKIVTACMNTGMSSFAAKMGKDVSKAIEKKLKAASSVRLKESLVQSAAGTTATRTIEMSSEGKEEQKKVTVIVVQPCEKVKSKADLKRELSANENYTTDRTILIERIVGQDGGPLTVRLNGSESARKLKGILDKMDIGCEVLIKQTISYVCEQLPPQTLRDAKGSGEATRRLQEELVERHPSDLVKATFKIKKIHVGETSAFGKVQFTISKEAAVELDGDPFLFFDFERRAVKRLVDGFKQCSKCASFLHEKRDCSVEGPLCIRCGGAHFDPKCAEPRRCGACARFRPESRIDHIAIGPSCPLRRDVQSGRVRAEDLREAA